MITRSAYAVLLTTGFLLLAYIGFGQTPNTLTPAEKQDHWTLLFDGQTLNGWQSYDKGSTSGKWEVETGALHLVDSKKGWDRRDDLITEETFGNFDLKIDWKVSPKGKSGVLFRVQQDQSLYPFNTGLQMEVLDNDGYPERRNTRHWAGDLYDLVAAANANVKPVGAWNESEIYCNGDTVKFYLNGVHTLTVLIWDNDWFNLIQNSVYKAAPQFGRWRTGKIDLQNRGFEVWYRNIKIKKLTPPAGKDFVDKPGGNQSDGNSSMVPGAFLVGDWKILSSRSTDASQSIFGSNQYVEFHQDRVVIARKDNDPEAVKALLFIGSADAQKLTLLDDNSVNTPFSYVLEPKLLTIRGRYGNVDQVIVLEKLSDNPLEHYKDYMPGATSGGSWALMADIENDEPQPVLGLHIDMHPETDLRGECVIYAKGAENDYSHLQFMQYTTVINAGRVMNIPPIFQYFGAESNDHNKHYYSFVRMNADGQSDADCYVSDGILIIREPGDKTTFYLMKAGSTYWKDMSTLHTEYNAHTDGRKLPAYGVH